MDSNAGLKVIAASRVGAAHLRVARNNQDAYAATRWGDRSVFVVADGCSMGAASEVGAVLGASWIAERLARASGPVTTREGARSLAEALAPDLDQAMLTWSGGDPALLARCFLFTYLALIVEREALVVIGAGDGLFGAPRARVVLDAGPDNAPAYAAYRVMSDDVFDGPRPPRAPPQVHHLGPIARGEVAWIGTDGAALLGDRLPAWLDEESTWRSPRALERRLNLSASELFDDTTLVAVKSCA